VNEDEILAEAANMIGGHLLWMADQLGTPSVGKMAVLRQGDEVYFAFDIYPRFYHQSVSTLFSVPVELLGPPHISVKHMLDGVVIPRLVRDLVPQWFPMSDN
jgi:hypothetical protein